MNRQSLFLLIIVLLIGEKSFALCVNADKANLRSGPGTNYRKTWIVGQYTPLVKLKSESGWYQVKDQDGEKHWVSKKIVDDEMSCISIKVNKTRLRKSPSFQAPYTVFSRVDRFSAFKVLRRDNTWFYVVDPWGQKGWLNIKKVWRPLKVMSVNF